MRYAGLILLLLLPLVTRAAVYKWIDDEGNVHYGDKPTASEPSVEVDVDDIVSVPLYGNSKGSMSREEKRERLLQSMEEDRLEKKQQREKQQALKQQNRKKCNRFRDRMRHFERASGIYQLDEDGNRIFMSDADRAKTTKNLQNKINKYCR
jgi:hypothetical protein